jgi:hypothetical protein
MRKEAREVAAEDGGWGSSETLKNSSQWTIQCALRIFKMLKTEGFILWWSVVDWRFGFRFLLPLRDKGSQSIGDVQAPIPGKAARGRGSCFVSPYFYIFLPLKFDPSFPFCGLEQTW